MTEWLQGNALQRRGAKGDLGGTMRLGAYTAVLERGSRVAGIYGTPTISERHRHRYEVNTAYRAGSSSTACAFPACRPTAAARNHRISRPSLVHRRAVPSRTQVAAIRPAPAVRPSAALVFAVNIVSTVFQPVFGYLADRQSRPWLIPVSMLAVGCGVSFSGIAPSYRVGLAALLVSGLGIAMFHPEGARLMNYLAGDRKATAMSLFGIGGQLGFALGPLIATAVLLSQGLKGTVYLIIPGAIMAALVLFMLPGLSSGYEKTGAVHKGVHGAGRDQWPAFICVASSLLCRSVIFYGLNTFLPLFWITVLHQSKGTAGSALGVLLGAAIVGNFRAGERPTGWGTGPSPSRDLAPHSLPPLPGLCAKPRMGDAAPHPHRPPACGALRPHGRARAGLLPNRLGLAPGDNPGTCLFLRGTDDAYSRMDRGPRWTARRYHGGGVFAGYLYGPCVALLKFGRHSA